MAATLNVSTASVSRVRKQCKENIPDSKIGRPSKVSQRTREVLARQFDTGKLLTLKDGQRMVQSVEGIPISTRSIWNYLNAEGLKGYVRRKRPDLTADQIKARYKFAKDHLKWTVDDWKNVMFSDETMFSKIGSFGKPHHYRRPKHKRLKPHQIQKTKQGGGGKLMMWGCMTFHGVGDACWAKEGVDSETYANILSEYVIASRDYYGMETATFVFQQDNARVHTTRIVKGLFVKKRIKVLEWPANSPDLNPIEHLWAYIKYRLGQYKESPSTLEELWERVQDIWVDIPIDYIHQLYESMPRRMKELHDNRGKHTMY